MEREHEGAIERDEPDTTPGPTTPEPPADPTEPNPATEVTE